MPEPSGAPKANSVQILANKLGNEKVTEIMAAGHKDRGDFVAIRSIKWEDGTTLVYERQVSLATKDGWQPAAMFRLVPAVLTEKPVVLE